MDSIGNIIQLLLVVCYTLALLGCICKADKLSAEQKAPQFANRSAGGSSSLSLPRDDSPNSGNSRSPLGQLLAGLRIKPSEQTPADTRLLKPSSRRTGGASRNALEVFHIKASGQTPADTSLLPRQQQRSNESPTSQSRRAGQRGPAHVTLIGPEQSSAADSAPKTAGRQTPANVGLLRPSGAGAPSRPGPASGGSRQDAVQREEMTSFKEVNGESVRVVVGNYGYESPEGLPVSFKYMSDENGNQASFSIGTPGSGAGGGSSSRPAGGGGGRGSGAGTAGSSKGTGGSGVGKGAAGGSTTGGATGGDGDRKYLPPK